MSLATTKGTMLAKQRISRRYFPNPGDLGSSGVEPSLDWLLVPKEIVVNGC